MNYTEKKQVANLMGRVNDFAAGEAVRFPTNGSTSEKSLYWRAVDQHKKILQDEIKALTGIYVPLG